MKRVESFSWKARLGSLRFAVSGFGRFFFEEHNALLHLVATVVVAVLIVFFRIRGAELLALLIVTAGVWITELINTAIEKIMDHLSPAKDPRVKYIKDLAAAAVLVAAVLALVTGIIVLTPKFFL